jgi:hypothetical protein
METRATADSKGLLREFLVFSLQPRSATFRDEVYRYLVKAALFGQEAGLTEGEVARSVSETLAPDREALVEVMLKQAIKALSEEGAVVLVEGRLCLEESEAARMTAARNRYTELQEGVHERLLERLSYYYRAIAAAQADQVTRNFDIFLTAALTRLGYMWASGVFGQGMLGKQYELSIDFEAVYQEARKDFHRFEDQTLEFLQKVQFRAFLQSKDKTLWDYFYALAFSYCLIRALGLDPRLSALTDSLIDRRRILLDTNVVHHLLLESGRLHADILLLVSTSLQLGVDVAVTERTIRELRKHLDDNFHLFYQTAVPGPEEAERIVALQTDNEYYDSFVRALSKSPGLSWQEFHSRFSGLPELLKSHGLEIEPEDESLLSQPAFGFLIPVAIQISQELIYSKGKTVDTARHDVYHLLLIEHSRKQRARDALGSQYWFITDDRTLFDLDRIARQRAELRDCVEQNSLDPFCMMWEDWMVYVSPFLLSSDDPPAKQAFVDLLTSDMLASAVGEISAQHIVLLLSIGVDLSQYTVEELEGLLGDEYVKVVLDEYVAGRDMEQLTLKLNLAMGNYMQSERNKRLEQEEEQKRQIERIIDQYTAEKETLQATLRAADQAMEERERQRKEEESTRSAELEQVQRQLKRAQFGIVAVLVVAIIIILVVAVLIWR